MIEVSYMPGCTLKTTGKNFEDSTLRLLEELDVKAVELEEWFCCGTTYSLASDNLMYHLAPIRTLIRAKETGCAELLVLCSMCYNTLRRAQQLILEDEKKRDKINDFMYKEQTVFNGQEVEVVHLLNYLTDIVGLEKIRGRIIKEPRDLRVALYYGCMLLKPKEVSIDASSEDPTIMEEFFTACGIEPVYFPFKTECCGSYQTVNEKNMVLSRTKDITGSAVKNGADILITSCPLCYFNLDSYQKKALETDPGFQTIPVMYISQLLALLMGIEDTNDFSLHEVDPRPILKEKGLLV
ncbi:CoB--CoM heterodisulfide reductase iron-sulfur subunit B family protein [Candidatus Poribacteria bacterium]